MLLTRINPRGLRFELIELNPQETVVSLHGTQKSICVRCNIMDLSNRWYRWQLQGKFIQDAFDNLSSDEREFLITGITPEEWKALFGEDS